MPLLHASRCEDDERRATTSVDSTFMSKTKTRPARAFEVVGTHSDDDRTSDAGDAPTSPRVRKRLDDAKESASLFNPGMWVGG